MIPHYGKAAAHAWQELSQVRVHGHLEDCVEDCHYKVKECQETDCMLKRMKDRAHRMSGRGRAALLAWFAVIASRVAGSHGPVHWSKSERRDYLDSLAEISKKIVQQGRPGVHTPLIEELAARVEQSAKSLPEC